MAAKTIGPIELDLEIPQRKPRSHEWGTRERETHNDRCERCSLGGQVVECFTCNTVWHRTCTDSLPSKGPTLQYWQCDTCVEEEIAKYGTSRDQLRPQQPALTAEETETATAEVTQIADESDDSQDEEQSDQEPDDSELDEEWDEQPHSTPNAKPATKVGGGHRIRSSKRRKYNKINLNGTSDDDDDELDVNTESNNNSNNEKDHTKSDTTTNNITLTQAEAKLTKQQQRGHPPPLLQQTEQGTEKPKGKSNIIDMSAATLDV